MISSRAGIRLPLSRNGLQSAFWRYISHHGVVREHDTVVLRSTTKGDQPLILTPPLLPTTTVKARGGSKIAASDIIGQAPRALVRASNGRAHRIHEASLAAYTVLSPRLVTPIYPHDAAFLVSLLDLHLPRPGEDADADAAPPFEIFEAGTGHGALTLHLARALHGANPPVPGALREALLDAKYRLRRMPGVDAAADDDVAAADEGADPATLLADPHALELPDDLAAQLRAYLASRRAVLHTLDRHPTYSRHAHKTVRGFRRAQYLLDADFHVGSAADYLTARLAATAAAAARDDRSGEHEDGDVPFLAHAVLDLPSPAALAGLLARALRPDGLLLVFAPSVTQIVELVGDAERDGLALRAERVIELPAGTVAPGAGGDAGTVAMSGARDWDVRTALRRRAPGSAAGGEPAAEGVTVCRPKVGSTVTFSGFVGVFRKLKAGPTKSEAGEDGGTANENASSVALSLHKRHSLWSRVKGYLGL